jgi:hypothetical protein
VRLQSVSKAPDVNPPPVLLILMEVSVALAVVAESNAPAVTTHKRNHPIHAA